MCCTSTRYLRRRLYVEATNHSYVILVVIGILEDRARDGFDKLCFVPTP